MVIKKFFVLLLVQIGVIWGYQNKITCHHKNTINEIQQNLQVVINTKKIDKRPSSIRKTITLKENNSQKTYLTNPTSCLYLLRKGKIMS